MKLFTQERQYGVAKIVVINVCKRQLYNRNKMRLAIRLLCVFNQS